MSNTCQRPPLKRFISTPALAVLGLILLTGCQSMSRHHSGLQVPAINASADNPIVWHELLSPDNVASRRFLINALGWQVSIDGPYTELSDHNGQLIGGIVDTRAMSWPLTNGGWLLSFSTDDLDNTLENVRELGGKVLREPWRLPDRGKAALIQDPQGAVMEVVELADGSNATALADQVWIWHELVTSDPEASADWYTSVFNLQTEEAANGRQLLSRNAVKIASISRNPFKEKRDQWLPVAAVYDFDATLERITRWEGVVVMTLEAASGRLALVQDPSGAAMLLQEQEVTP